MAYKYLLKQFKNVKKRALRKAMRRLKQLVEQHDRGSVRKAKPSENRRRRILRAEAKVSLLKKVSLTERVDQIWIRLGHGKGTFKGIPFYLEKEGVKKPSRPVEMVRSGYDEKERAALDEFETSREIDEAKDVVRSMLDDAIEKARKKRKLSKRKAAERSEREQQKRDAPDSKRRRASNTLGRRDAKRSARAEEWRRKQAQRERSETKQHRRARARVSESVFVDSLASSASPSSSSSFSSRKTNRASAPHGRTNNHSVKGKTTKEAVKTRTMKPRPIVVDDKPLHPSWAAKKQTKPTIVAFKGNRVTFDD